MYKISVPVMSGNVKRQDRERLLKEVKRFDAQRIFLALDCYQPDEKKRRESMEVLADNCRFFKAHGFEVGSWNWTFMFNCDAPFHRMRDAKGNELSRFACPTDDDFIDYAKEYIREIARTGVDIIMFDDDFRYGFLGSGFGCLCDGHLDLIRKITGEESLTREEVAAAVTTGGKNKLRDAFLQANGDAFRKFTRAVRAAADEVNPKIRMAACSCMSGWDLDGSDEGELARILAGGNRPLVRLIGAPYWAARKSWGNCLQDVVELERMESAWTRFGDLEIMAEGDAYPRPRNTCPASYLEGFDTAIRASGCTDGILKYGIDYCSNADYETGYARFHERNRPLYDAIDRHFGNKRSVGVRVYESMKKIADSVPGEVPGDTADAQNLFFSMAARTLAWNSVPTVYEGAGVAGAVFGENARNLPLEALNKGLILDAAAAKILTDRGIDVGVAEFGGAAASEGSEEFLNNGNHILSGSMSVYKLSLKEGAKILSQTQTSEGALPVSFTYENASGNRFLILNLDPRALLGSRNRGGSVLEHYARSRQYADLIPWLGGEKLPAYVYGHPALYLQCKEASGALAVGLWNFHPDIAMEPVVELAKSYTRVEFINCTGVLEGDRVTLTDIPAYGFAGFVVE